MVRASASNVVRSICLSILQLIVDHIYQVLSCQTLTDLRDKIRCVSDLMVEGEFSVNPDLPSDVCAKEIYKSGFFFIEDKFYNDMRDPDCRDYSRVIMDWAATKPRGMGPLESVVMENVKFDDLCIRLGHPYLYMHQGNCEHLIVFSDIRMLQPDDILDIREYPLMTMRRTKQRTFCKVCLNTASRWVTLNDELAPENPCYFCDPCFRSLHYDEDGKKVCKFEAYKYFDSHVVL
ncbi:snRNA-activating protein complex subunit 3-like [Liolophura sinensis]|uniref:snRNA-activating protein complex subunit 3-like n=1 Tax=Liolophura sinensis TaxID=3198878 RepID=UPI00315976F5